MKKMICLFVLTLATSFNSTLFSQDQRSMELSGITAEQNENSVKITWNVLSETNLDLYSLERSSDAINFSEVSTIEVYENSNVPKEYSIQDKVEFNGYLYYRIHLTDNNGSSAYSQIVSVYVSQEKLVMIYPNPAYENEVHFRISKPETEVKVIGRRGRVMFSKIYANEGDVTENMKDLLEKGIYFVTFQSATELETHKMIID